MAIPSNMNNMEHPNIEFYYRTIGELRSNAVIPLEDPKHIIVGFTESMRLALLDNPCVGTDEEVCQIIAYMGNQIVGCIGTFNARVRVDDKITPSLGATTMLVDPEYRRYNIGSDLMTICYKQLPIRDIFVAGSSRIAQPLYKAMRFSIFSFPRYIFLRKSRCAVQYALKNEAAWTKVVASCVDCVLTLQRAVLFSRNAKAFYGYVIESVKECPQQVADIAMNDGHRYAEVHDKAWFDWCLAHRFVEEDRNSKQMYVVKNADGMIVAFFVNKIEFFAEASTRGFKNVQLGSVVEWGIAKNSSITEVQLQMLAIRTMPNDVDGVQVGSTDEETIRSFKRQGFFPMGEANNLAFIKSVKDKSIKDINNWRIRIAGGDTLIE